MKRQLTRRELLKLGLYSTAAFATGTGVGACSREPRFQGPARHVILISLDTTRRDHIGCYVKSWIQTPQIDALARESIIFDRHITPVTTTLASHTSIFTGKYPQSHGVPRNGYVVNPENILLTRILGEAGFHTAGFLGSFALDSRFGFARGFDDFDEDFDILGGTKGRDQSQRIAGSVTDTVIEYLDRIGVPGNLFLFAHYFDPHQPYTPPPPFDRTYREAVGIPAFEPRDHPVLSRGQRESAEIDLILRYAGEVTYTDSQVGRLLTYLGDRGILDDSIVILTGDHGENMDDAPGGRPFNHGWTVYEPEIRAPLLVRLPGGERGGARSAAPSSHIDLLPTLTGFLGLPTPPGTDGTALDLTGSELDLRSRVLFSEATKPWKNVETDPLWFNARKARCALLGTFKYIRTEYRELEELYDLSQDPHETVNLLQNPLPAHRTVAQELRNALSDWAASARPLATHFDASQRDETIRRLRSLGYIT